ncbi:MAG: hypothetical protein K0Q96_1846 [Rubrobacteraceae bacterium]|nr:hypothetical protein [Rubrobacteraceae bacterium]
MMTVPPAWLTVRAPSVPSVPVPLSTIAMRFSPKTSAADSMSRFMEGMGWPEAGSELRSISESVMFTCLLAGTTKTTPA